MIASWRRTLRGLLCAALLPLAAGATVLGDEIEHFNQHFEAGDFAAIEAHRAELERSQARSPEGLPLADEYVSFDLLATCVRGPEGARPGRCEARYGELAGKWARAFPDSALPRAGLAELAIARVEGTRLAPPQRAMLLEQAWNSLRFVPREARDVVWYRAAFHLAVVEGWGPRRFQALLDEGMARFAQRPLFVAAAAAYTFPRNGGTVAEVEAFARRMEAAAPGAAGKFLYATVYDQFVFTNPDGFWPYAHSRLDWPTMRAGLEEAYRRFPGTWNRNRFAQHACLAEDLPTLARLVQEMPPVGPDGGWFQGEAARCRALVKAVSGGQQRATR